MRTTPTTTHRSSRRTTSIGDAIPNVWTDLVRRNSIGAGAVIPLIPRIRSRRVSGSSARIDRPVPPAMRIDRIGAP
jgi:hypothetical protein